MKRVVMVLETVTNSSLSSVKNESTKRGGEGEEEEEKEEEEEYL